MTVAALLLCGPGCIVTSSTYEVKAREADTLRDALGSLNREKAKLIQENEELSRQAASCKEDRKALSSQVSELEVSLKRLEEGMPGPAPTSGGSGVSRQQFVDELLEREKATGRRLQELSERTERCERELERIRQGPAPAGR